MTFIQEVVFSRCSYIQCDEASLPWSDFCVGWLSLSGIIPSCRPDIIPSVSSYAQVMQLILSYHKAGSPSSLPDLLSLLENHRSARATDPRDKVCGFLGLYEEKGTRVYGIVPDYRRTVSETFFDSARRITEHDPTLNILGVPRLVLQCRMDGLPSWAPDWSADVFASSLRTRMIDGAHVYDFDAVSVHETPKHVDIHDKTLELSGNCFDEAIAVEYVADPYFKSDKGSERLRLTAAASIFHTIALGLDWLLVSGELSEKKYPDGQNAFEPFVRTIYLDDFSGLYSAGEVTEYYGNLYIPFYLLSKESKMRSPGLKQVDNSHHTTWRRYLWSTWMPSTSSPFIKLFRTRSLRQSQSPLLPSSSTACHYQRYIKGIIGIQKTFQSRRMRSYALAPSRRR